ncbi:hypothetical protein OGZ37_06850 [Lactococcus lactis]|uniref:hypothetical protein n=1 Tax=Lactococcus lactis TaxID=1358 RepID=UPI0024189C52|nr:hypothetical protein [Lactococcus lactis]MDG4966294.1 hypothetical protein [Lactococcus lactis]
MLFFKLILIILLITFGTFIYRYFQTKEDYQGIKSIKSDFENWLLNKSDSENCRPNNATFTHLYEKAYGQKSRALTHMSDTGNRIKLQRVDVIESFPTKDKQIAAQLIQIIDNLEDYFQFEFNAVRQPKYWIKFVIFFPQKLVQSLGIKSKYILTYSFNFLIWGIGIFISLFGSDIRDFIVSLFK